MTEKKLSSLGFELSADAVDPTLPLLFRIVIAHTVSNVQDVIYIGKSDNGAGDLLSK
ncbi:hypothetical protein [Paraburkholderia sp. MM6662-R1]|uniref:hypothetical protein n=1 Tax=Paraburkholderia sp. MM6662-R1 TaxID=2991066 RepID=UPI003D1ADC1E